MKKIKSRKRTVLKKKRTVQKVKTNKSTKFHGRKFLVFDDKCDFCSLVAGFFAYHWNIHIVANTKVPDFLEKDRMMKDVHYVVIVSNSIIVYSGPEAVVRLLATKYPSISKLYEHRPFRLAFNIIYRIVKKSRKYL